MLNTQLLANDIVKYLTDKAPEISYSTALEIAEFVVLKTSNIVIDEVGRAISDRDKTWKAELNRRLKFKRGVANDR